MLFSASRESVPEGWGRGSSSRVPALQVQRPESKLQYHQQRISTRTACVWYLVLAFFYF
jgi:hypothetical protein